MARPLTTLVVFFLAFNLLAGILLSTGIAGMLNLDADVGEDEKVTESVNQAEKVSTGTPLGNTLFGMYNVLAGGLQKVFAVIFPGLSMLERAGVPSYITKDLLAPLFSFVIFIDFVSFLRGWGL